MSAHRQRGLGYIEVILAAALLALALVPALDALRSALSIAAHSADLQQRQLARRARMEAVLAEPFGALLAEAALHNDARAASRWSDPPGSAGRLLVQLQLHDFGNLDGDGDSATIADPDLDGDANPYSGDDSPVDALRVRVLDEDGGAVLDALSLRR